MSYSGNIVCYVFFKLDGLAVNFSPVGYFILGFSLFLYAKLLVSIPSYVYFLDGYNQGVGEAASQNNPPPATQMRDLLQQDP